MMNRNFSRSCDLYIFPDNVLFANKIHTEIGAEKLRKKKFSFRFQAYTNKFLWPNIYIIFTTFWGVLKRE